MSLYLAHLFQIISTTIAVKLPTPVTRVRNCINECLLNQSHTRRACCVCFPWLNGNHGQYHRSSSTGTTQFVADGEMANVMWRCVRTAGAAFPRLSTTNSRRGCAYSCNEFNGTVFSVIRRYSNLNGSVYDCLRI